MSNDKLPSFAPVESRRNLLISFLLGTFCAAWILFSAGMFFCALYFILAGSDESPGLWLFILAISIFFNLLWIGIWKGYRKRAYTGIRIDEKGIQYNNHITGKTVKAYSWEDFRKSPDDSEYDIQLYTRSGWVNGARISSDSIRWWYRDGKKQQQRDENFVGGHILHATGNRHELIAGLLLGFAHFRPDLQVEPLLFSTFFVDNVSYRFEKKSFYRTWFFAIIAIIILFLLIEWYMKYRFGESLIW